MAQFFVFAWVILHAEALIYVVQRWKKLFDKDVVTQKGSSNFEMCSCWDSERDGFSENCVVDFTVGCIN